MTWPADDDAPERGNQNAVSITRVVLIELSSVVRTSRNRLRRWFVIRAPTSAHTLSQDPGMVQETANDRFAAGFFAGPRGAAHE